MPIAGAKARKTFHWEDMYKGENLMYRIPKNIYYNDNVVVREDEWAVFIRDGKVLAVFDRPGRYALTTQNLPILASLGAALTGIKQLGEVYYVQRREMRGKFGTTEPLAFRDTEFGLVRLRIFGDFSYKVMEPTQFITQFIGTKGMTSTDEVIVWLRKQLVMSMNDALGELKRDQNISIVDMPAYLEEFEQVLLSKVADDTDRYGLKVMKIVGLNINLPEEVQEAIDKRGAMSALGVDYMQYQTGKAIGGIGEGAAQGGGGGGAGNMAGMGAGMGAGFGMAASMSQAMAGSGTQPVQQAAAAPKRPCPKCNAMIDQDAKFCPSCGYKFPTGEAECPSCHTSVAPGTKFCPNCGNKLGGGSGTCPKCNEEVGPGVKFCPNCGNKM